MKAADARELKVGEFVSAMFAGYVKTCEITAIDWPTFHLLTKDCRGDEMRRTRRYQSLIGRCAANRPTSRGHASWLKWPEKPSDAHAPEDRPAG